MRSAVKENVTEIGFPLVPFRVTDYGARVEFDRLNPTPIPYGRIPAIWHGSCSVKQIENTRIFVDRGTEVDFRHWMNEVHKANPGNLIPLQWAPDFIGVTRPGIRRRLLGGKLTQFSFTMLEPAKTILGRVEYRESRKSYDYLIKDECEAWREELWQKRDEDYIASQTESDRHGDLPPSLRKKRGRK